MGMNRLVKWLLGLVGLLAVAAGLFVAYFFVRYPKVQAAENVRVEVTPERVARGKYLAEHVTGCVVCHADRDWNKFAGEIVEGTKGTGGQRFGFGLEPFVLYAKNITPAGVGQWTDGELIRAITTGVSRDGTPLFPLMPYPKFARLAREDVEAIVAYLRTLPSVPSEPTPARELKFPLPLVVRTIPAPAAHRPIPSPTDRVAYGEYMTNAALCAECHTPLDEQGTPIPGMEFAGGTPFTPGGVGFVRSANITPDAGTGIGTWTEEQFLDKFRAFRGVPPRTLSSTERLQNTEMPWNDYAGMTDDDLRAIYAFLRSRPPVVNRVDKFGPPPTR
jgi:mono/diheme cytochrome c family protein